MNGDEKGRYEQVEGCVFCTLLADPASRERLFENADAIIFEPLGPIVPGHVLVVPRQHVADAAVHPGVTGRAFKVAARYARDNYVDFNLITSAGANATQTVMHLHVHIVPRTADDGLLLPWSNQDPRERQSR